MTKHSTDKKAPKYSDVVRHNSSDSEHSDAEDRSHSRTSTSSVEEEVIKGTNGNIVRKTTTTTTTTIKRQTSGSSTSSNSSNASSNANGTPNSTGFLARVSSIPLVYDSVNTIHTYAKDNKYGRYALNTASSAVDTVNKYTEPYQKSLQPHLTKVDQLANKSLDIIEDKFPIVTKPTSEIVGTIKKPFESSKNAYTQIQSTIDNKVATPAKQATNNITTKATTTATQIASNINTRAIPLVDGIETIVNRYLPGETITEPNQNQAARVIQLTRSVSGRVSSRLGGPQSAAELRQLAENNPIVNRSNAIVNRSKESVYAFNTRLTTLLENLRVQAKEQLTHAREVPSEVSIQLQTRVTSLIAQLDSLSTYLKENGPKLPESVQVRIQARIHPLVVYLNERYAVVKGELAKSDLTAAQKARNILQLTTDDTIPILLEAAKEIKKNLILYQINLQENVLKGVNKVYDVNSSLQTTASQAYHNVRYVIVGSK